MRSGLAILSALVLVGAFACSSGDTSFDAAASSSSAAAGGAGGAPPSCAELECQAPGEVCVDGACLADCRRSGANPCAPGTVCDVSAASPGACVPPGSACLTTSPAEACGERTCGPGSVCDGAGKCYPRLPCGSVDCDDATCWGTFCACERVIDCAPAPLGAPGEKGTLHDPAFVAGLVDLEFDPACGAWGATLISGPDYLRSIEPKGAVASYAGVTNLNMGEVSVLQQIAVPKSDPPLLDVALTYICCATCGCELGSTPQGVARFEPATSSLPLVVPSKTFTTGVGPFGGAVIDTGPAGLSYGFDRVLYVGNVDANGDYFKLDLATQKQSLVTTFAARVHASTPFDAITMLVALEGGALVKLRLSDATSSPFATSTSPVLGMVRDVFDGSIYVSRRDGAIWRYDANGVGAAWQTTVNPSRLAIAGDGYLYALAVPPPFYDHTPAIARWQLPTTR
ncbi:MAG: hypothetical protein FJ095_11440 [Deltaproteobacteria bacterium]|nr:hypothetical protein [Deltaproteobacteria bacterium]